MGVGELSTDINHICSDASNRILKNEVSTGHFSSATLGRLSVWLRTIILSPEGTRVLPNDTVMFTASEDRVATTAGKR